ncbi:hypothetical protein [Peribacillus simplex]|uniref:Helicase mobile element region n=1 Tax=Peribacillus simplex TaxID=1478 RepID=A0AAN2PCR8_9BACI|nr:hypothetical protein [Peribacillus simplex]CEG30034.1 helicase; mobile element region [Peribacillus simplex]
MKDRIWESIITFLITGILTFLSSYGITYFIQKSISVVTIGDSTKIEEKQFLHLINISAFEDIKNLRISVPSKITEKQIKSNVPINIKIVKNNIGPTSDSVFDITKIASDSNVELILMTDQPLNAKEVIINNNGNKVDVEYTSELKNPITGQIKSLALNAIMFATLLGLTTYFVTRYQDKRMKKYTDEHEKISSELREESDRMNQGYKQMDQRYKQTEKYLSSLETRLNNSKKRTLLLQAKLNDYRKELNFWRNTIRKIIYQSYESPKGEKKAEQLMEIVSSSLKTYQTNEKQDHDFESLKVLSKMIKDIDED